MSHANLTVPKLIQKVQTTVKPVKAFKFTTTQLVMLWPPCLWDARGVTLVDYLLKGHIINGAFYATFLEQLLDDVKTMRFRQLRKGLLSHRYNGPVHCHGNNPQSCV